MKQVFLLFFVIITYSFISWTPPFFFEFFPPANVKKVTQIRLKEDGTEYKTGQIVREFSKEGQLIKYYNIESGPHRDSVRTTPATIANLNSEGKVVSYETPGGDMFSLSAKIMYPRPGSLVYLSPDSNYCMFTDGKLISVTHYEIRSSVPIAYRKEILHYDKSGRIIEEKTFQKNSLVGIEDIHPDSLVLEIQYSWLYVPDNKTGRISGYKFTFNNNFKENDTIEKRVFNKKNEMVRSCTYQNHKSWFRDEVTHKQTVRNQKDSACWVYKYEYF
jgi:hypothetical protein